MDKKKVLIYSLALGTLGVTGYLIYEYFTKKPPQITNVVTGQTISNPSTLPGYTGPGIPGTIYVSTSIPPYSTASYTYSLGSLPFSFDIYAGWIGSQPINATFDVELILQSYEAKAFNSFVVGQNTLNLTINLGEYPAVLEPYTKVKIPVSIDLYSNQNIYDLLYNYLVGLADLTYFVFLYFNAILSIDIYLNGVYVGTYQENFTLLGQPI